MTRTIRLQSDSNAHDRPWRVAVEQGFFADEGLDVVYHEDNPKGADGRVKDFAHRWKETQLREGALEVYPVCEWGAIERVQQLGKGKIIGLDTTVRTGAIMVKQELRRAARLPTCATGDRRHLACRHVLCRDRGHGSGRRSLRARSSSSTRPTGWMPCSADATRLRP